MKCCPYCVVVSESGFYMKRTEYSLDSIGLFSVTNNNVNICVCNITLLPLFLNPTFM